MTPAAPASIKVARRAAFGLGETLLRLILLAAIPISAVVFAGLTF